MTSPNGSRPARGRSFAWFADAKAGKTTLADSGPAPRVILDVEGGCEDTPSRKTDWNPLAGPPPQPGRRVTAGYGQPSVTPAWETALVTVHDTRAISAVYDVLSSGRHPFNSASIDSTTMAQNRIIDSSFGQRQIEQQGWGFLARQTSWLIRSWKDLTQNPVKPVWAVCFVAGMEWDDRRRRFIPMLAGRASKSAMPYYPDVTGFVYHGDGGSRWVKIGYDPMYETGNRVGGKLPDVMPVAYPGYEGWTVEIMVSRILTGG